MNRAERQSRALEMFIAGATYRQISDRLEMTEAAVEKAVQKAMAGAAARRRELLADEATAVFAERTEALFRAHYPAALRGDHRSAQICLSILTTPKPADSGESAIASSLAGGDEAKALEALRDRLAREMDACKSPRVLAALSRQFVGVIAQLAELKPPAPSSKRDDLARKRAERLQRAAAGGGPGAADPGGAAGADERSS